MPPGRGWGRRPRPPPRARARSSRHCAGPAAQSRELSPSLNARQPTTASAPQTSVKLSDKEAVSPPPLHPHRKHQLLPDGCGGSQMSHMRSFPHMLAKRSQGFLAAQKAQSKRSERKITAPYFWDNRWSPKSKKADASTQITQAHRLHFGRSCSGASPCRDGLGLSSRLQAPLTPIPGVQSLVCEIRR